MTNAGFKLHRNASSSINKDLMPKNGKAAKLSKTIKACCDLQQSLKG